MCECHFFSTTGLHVNVTQSLSTSMSSPLSTSENSSFAAALRKLAEQAMSPGSQSPVSVLPPPSNHTISPMKSNGELLGQCYRGNHPHLDC